jgi:hypothetical protein
MIVYKKTNGMAHDLRFTDSPDKDDITLTGDRLPDIDTLHDAGYIEARDKEKANQAIKDKLSEIDAKSIRSLREWMAKQGDAPQFLRDYETQAKEERAKLI